MELEKLKIYLGESKSWTDLCKKVFGGSSSYRIKKLRRLVEQQKLDISHFSRREIQKKIIKNCPVCKKEFKTIPNPTGKKEQVTCSHSCSNTFFKTDYTAKFTNYRKRALDYYGCKCQNCGERRLYVLQVHHKDRNRHNNKLDNLSVLCANCHLELHYKEDN